MKENISVWRAVSCIMVFAVHFGQRIDLQGMLRNITDHGALGVQFFFIISGFLIANSFFYTGTKILNYILRKE